MAELIHLLVEFAAVTGLDRLWQRRGEELVVTCVVLLVAAVLQRLAQRRAQGCAGQAVDGPQHGRGCYFEAAGAGLVGLSKLTAGGAEMTASFCTVKLGLTA